jgi:outer membrane protein assembly factor BamB
MSDYIAELRRELVGAAERERRRHAPRRALRRVPRPPLALALAGVAAAAALVLGIVRALPAPTPAGPRIVETIRVGGIPVSAALADGRVWISNDGGSVVAIDPATRRRVATIPVGQAVTGFAASRDALWVIAARDQTEPDYRLVRIDPASDRIVARLTSFGPLGASLVATPDAAWVQTAKRDPVPLRRVDPATNRVGGDYGRHELAVMAGTDERLWLLRMDGVLEWRDARTGSLLGSVDGFARNIPGGAWRSGIAPDAEGAYVATADDGAVTRVARDGRFRWSIGLRANGPLAVAHDALWVSTGDELTASHNALLRLDPRDGHVTWRLPLGARTLQAVLPVGNELWAFVSDGTVLVIR